MAQEHVAEPLPPAINGLELRLDVLIAQQAALLTLLGDRPPAGPRLPEGLLALREGDGRSAAAPPGPAPTTPKRNAQGHFLPRGRK